MHAYGLLIAIGVVIGVWLAQKRWLARGGTAQEISTLAPWGVPCGIVGARIYHIITDYELYRHDPIRAFYIWDGGLGIWGGVAAGVAAGAIVGKRRGLSGFALMDMVAPSLILAQAIGRWGNYFNQELFGRPTTQPWGLRIDLVNRPPGYENYATFQPTFLYESLWDLLVFLILLAVEKRFKPRAPQIFLLYVSLYTFGRFFTERLRIDYAHTFWGLRLNDWVSITVFVAAMALMAIVGLRDHKTRAATTISP